MEITKKKDNIDSDILNCQPTTRCEKNNNPSDDIKGLHIDDKSIENQSHNIIKHSNYDIIVLSGGSVNGLMLLGSLQYCFDNFYLNNINTYIGTSVGSIISYLLAIGYDPSEIMSYLCINNVFDKLKFFNIVAAVNGNGATSFYHIHEHLEKMTINKIGRLITLKDLYTQFNKTIICTTYNLTKDKTEYLSHSTNPDLPCLTALRMSCNLPLIFENFKYNGDNYIDGGITDNFAIDLAETLGEKILGIYINGNCSPFINMNENGILEYIYKLMFIPISNIVQYKIKLSSIKSNIISITGNVKAFFDFNISIKERLDMFSTGYNEALKQM